MKRRIAITLALGFVSLSSRSADLSVAPPPAYGGSTQALPAAVDLRPAFEKWGLGQRRQGKRGTCSVFTLTGALEFAAAKQQQRGQRFSVEFLNWASSQVIGRAKDGGFFSDLWKGFAAYGICPEKDLPYRADFDPALAPPAEVLTGAKATLTLGLKQHWIKPWNIKTGLTDEQFLSVKRTLNTGWPVCGGFRWPKEPKWTEHVLQMCSTDAVFDGHSLLIVGYRDDAAQPGGGVFLFRNTDNGGRDGCMPYTYAQTYMNDAVWIESDAPKNPPGNASVPVGNRPASSEAVLP
jgi:hypothetical protein